VLTCEGIAGLKMTIKAGSMRDARGLPVTPQNPAQVSLNQVHHNDVPMAIPVIVYAWVRTLGRVKSASAAKATEPTAPVPCSARARIKP